MHSLLLAIESRWEQATPSAPKSPEGKWFNTCKDLGVKKKSEVQELAFGCWLVPITKDGLHFLGEAIAEAQKNSLDFKLLFFEDKPELHPQSPGKVG